MRRLTVIFFCGLLAASAWAYAPERKLVRPEHLRYVYDSAGNLLRRTNRMLVQTFGNNALNQLPHVTRSGPLTVSGPALRLASSFAESAARIRSAAANLFVFRPPGFC